MFLIKMFPGRLDVTVNINKMFSLRRFSLLIIVLQIILLININSVKCGFHYGNNACKTLEDYRTFYKNKNCWFDPDVGSSPRLIAKRYGFEFEKHQVTTEDGYILTLHRIPNSSVQQTRRRPILIVHGLAGASTFWMMMKKRSLAFFLSNNGYDVWLGNLRGNYYSDKHVNQTMSNAEYWNFSFHESAIYDLPACIDFIAEKTGGRGDLIYIGHSMGTTISYIYSSLMSEHAKENLKTIVSLAPVAYMGHVRGSFGALAPLTPFLADILRSKGIHVLLEAHAFQKLVLGQTCGKYPFIIPCYELLKSTSGYAPDEFQAELLPLFFDIYPSAVSLKTFLHFSQLITSGGQFRHYDHGPKKNLELYQSAVPPDYDTSKIKVPVHLFVGSEDILAPMQDVEALADRLQATQKGINNRTHMFPYAHNDFFMAKHVDDFYKTLLDALQA